MKKILSFALLATSISAIACPDVSGVYDLPKMSALCSSDRDYTPGDDSPLYTVFPAYESEYPSGAIGNPGYVEPGQTLKVEIDSSCEEVSISYMTRNSVILEPENAIHKMKFKIDGHDKNSITVVEKRKTPYGCEMGVCGSIKEKRELVLTSDQNQLLMKSQVIKKGILYFIPYREKEVALDCRFDRQ